MAGAAPRSENRDWLWSGLLVASTLLAYRPAWSGRPVWDDAAHLTRPALRSAAGLAAIWTQLGATQQYYPLLHSVFWFEHHLWGDWTTGYHLFSILLHASSALLVVRIVRRLGLRGAWLAGALFALHPVMVESVAWMTELKNTLSGVLCLGAALTYLKFDDERAPNGDSHANKHYAAALALFLLGLLVKSVIATLPAALLVVCWWRRGRLSWRRDVVPLLPFFAVGIAAGLLTAWVERKLIGAEGAEFTLSVLERCLIAGRAVWFYLAKLVWPAELVFIYPRWHLDPAAAWQSLYPAALLLVAALCWGLRHRSRAPLAVLLYFVVTLFPALGFFNVYPFRYSFVADHFQYLAALGPLVAGAALLARGLERLGERLPRAVSPLLVAALPALLFVLTWNQSRLYSDAETLYRAVLAGNDDCWMAHTNLGLLLMDDGRSDEAMEHLQKAFAIHPLKADAYNNLGLLLAHLGRTEEAMADYRRALALNPDHADAHNNLGILLARAGHRDEALAHYQRALALHPGHAEVHYNLGDLLGDLGRTGEAAAEYERALELDPTYADAHNNLGLLLADAGRTAEAIAQFRQALEANPRSADAHNNLGVMLAKVGRPGDALAHYRRSVELDPLDLNHLDNLVSALLTAGQPIDAVATLRKALETARAGGDEARAEALARALARAEGAISSARAATPRSATE
jgi:tetratricopeptide (TPR) repeat protein